MRSLCAPTFAVLVWALPSACSSPAAGTTYVPTHYVAPFAEVAGATSDLDTVGGTPFASATDPRTPCTFGEALEEATAGNVVSVAPGVYVAPRTGDDRWMPAFAPAHSGTADSPLIFFAAYPAAYNSAQRSELRYTGPVGAVLGFGRGEVDASDVIFDGFYINAALNQIPASAGLAQIHRATRCELRRMYFDQNTEWGDGTDNYNMIFAGSNFGCRVTDSVFQGNDHYNPHHNLASIETYDSEGLTVEHCEFVGVGVGVFAKGEYIDVPGSNSLVIRYNRFVGLSSNAIELGTTASDVGNAAYQNLSYDTSNGGGGIRFENSGGGYKNNAFYNNTIEGGITIRAIDQEQAGGNRLFNNIIYDGIKIADTGGVVEVLHDYGVSDLHNPYDYFTVADYNVFFRSNGQPALISGNEGALFSTPVTLSGWQNLLAAANVAIDVRQTHSLDVDPVFVDPGNHDYRLAARRQASRTASNTGGPVGCYITGSEEIGLRATPTY